MNHNPYEDVRVPSPEELGATPDYRSPADLALIAQAIRALKGNDRLFFAARMVEADLMRLAPDGEFPMFDEVMAFARESGTVGQAAAMMFSMDEEILSEFIEATANHCERGTDATDTRSAGGWNVEELTKVYANLYVARRGLSIPFGANVQ